MTTTNTLDPTIADLCDLASVLAATDRVAAELAHLLAFASPMWLAALCTNAAVAGFTLGQALASQMTSRLLTGYMNKAQRNAVAHGLYSMGVRTPAAKPTDDERARAIAAKGGFVGGVYAGVGS